MNFEGNLNSLILPNVLQLLNKEGADGVLTITLTGKDLTIFIEHGEVVYANGVNKEDQLLGLLRRKGILNESVHKRLLDVNKTEKFALGPYLLNNKLISQDAWQRFLKIKVEQVMLRAFLAEDADFKFSNEPFALPGSYKTNINLMQLILDITRKIDEWNFIRKHIPDRNIIFQTCEDLSTENQTINFNRYEWAVLSKIDGKRTVDDIISQTDLEELQILKILYSFLSSGLIKRLENVYLNWKGNFVDYEGVISLYVDLYKILEKNLQPEIGKEFYRIYERSLASLENEGNTLLNGFYPFNHGGSHQPNVQEIIKRLAKQINFNEGKRELLMGFNTVIRSMVDEINIIVGKKLIEKTLNEIYATISFVGKYQQQTSDINAFVLDTLKGSLEE